MNVPTSFVGFDVLKRAVSMAQVLGRYGLLERLHRSGDSLRGPCPLHAGHNPTQFRVNLSRNCWMCFGDCNGGGSIIDFVSRKEGVGIRAAALLIQDWFGVPPTNGEGSGPVQSDPKPCHDSGEALPAFNPPLRFEVRDLDVTHPYLRERGLTEETLRAFGVGVCCTGTLEGRLVIPIQNAQGDVVAYATRWLGDPPEGQPKYLLPRGFRKSLELFNLHRARGEAADRPLVVVEGYFGCLRIWQAGHRKVVALMGSRLSERQAELIVETVGPDGTVLLLFDADPAGHKGSRDAQERLGRSIEVRVLRLEGEIGQPDQLSAEALLEVLESAG